MPQDYDDSPFEIDHVIAIKHHGRTTGNNLALSCFYCNSSKGSNIGGLFHPRRHKWQRHFRWEGAYLLGRTPIGRVTIDVLCINDPLRVELREALIAEGVFP